MIIKNAQIYTDEFRFRPGELAIENGRIAHLSDDGPAAAGAGPEEILDAEGAYLLPGLVDIHFHGCMGQDFCDGTREAVETLAAYEAKEGITSICPAALTLPAGELRRILANAAACRDTLPRGSADLIGVNMEGPFISRVKKGAQNENYIIPCDTKLCRSFLEASGGLVRLVGLAPEENPDYLSFIAAMKDDVRISLAHTNAGYETAMAAFAAGASHAVHLFNGMPEMLHRSPGVAGAVLDSPEVTAEVICDGNHLHDAMIRAIFRMLGAERIVLISDSLRLTGMGEGSMLLGGKKVQVTGKRAVLTEGGNLAGSVTNLADCLRLAVRQVGIPLEQAVRCATFNPARAIGREDCCGLIREGRKADLLLLNQDLSLRAVFKDGQLIRS